MSIKEDPGQARTPDTRGSERARSTPGPVNRFPWQYSQLTKFFFYCNIFYAGFVPIYKKIYKQKTNKTLNLKHPKTFGEKIQYLKLYDNLPIKAQLTDKIEVLNYAKLDFGNQSIANLMRISIYSVKVHMKSILRKLNVKTITEAVIKAIQLGIIDLY